MGKLISVLALITGLGLAVAMRSTGGGSAPMAGPDLPALADTRAAGVTIGDDWPPATDLAGLQSGCGTGCGRGDFRPLAPWEAAPPLPEITASQGLAWPGKPPVGAGAAASPGLRPASALGRLRATPLRFAAEPLSVDSGDASLADAPRFKLAPAPEPHSWAMLLAGMLMIGSRMRRRRQASTYLATL